MDLFSQFFNSNPQTLSELESKNPFNQIFRASYLKCFNIMHAVKEFDWKRYVRENNLSTNKNVYNEAASYIKWTHNGRSNAFVLNSDEIYTGFPWKEYLYLYRDLKQSNVCNEISLYLHWVNHGRSEKRTPFIKMHLNTSARDAFVEQLLQCCVLKTEGMCEFDWERYLHEYPDLTHMCNEQQAYKHWSSVGNVENRNARVLDRNEYYIFGFPWRSYMKHNPDLQNISTEMEAYNHWVTYGRNQKRAVLLETSIKPNLNIFNETYDHLHANLTDVLNNCKKMNLLDRNATMLENLDQSMKYRKLTEIDFSNKHILTPNILPQIFENIDWFSEFIKPYKNLIFISSDYPGYGGAATNCENLATFYANSHNICRIYIHDDNLIHEDSDSHCIHVNHVNLQNVLKTLTFKPDAIILKNSVDIHLKRIFNCPVIFLIPGIYKDHLNVDFSELNTLEQQNMFINASTLQQIRRSDYSFCNSAHVKYILQKWYNLNTLLYYSTFVKHYHKSINEDELFEFRKYDYGLIVSNFDRKIKNIQQCIMNIPKNKKTLLIGRGSTAYRSHGFTTIELLNHNAMHVYYKQIKYIVQNSFFESCSNVIVEGRFNGCKLHERVIQLTCAETYHIKKNEYYLIGQIDELYDLSCNIFDLFTYNKYNSYIIEHRNCNALIFCIICDEDTVIDHNHLFEKSVFNNKRIGVKRTLLTLNEVMQSYYLYGKYNIDIKALGLSLFYDSYVNDKHRKYNRELYTLIWSYYYGTIGETNFVNYLNKTLNRDIFHITNALLISKLIQGYGGVQKTSHQLIQTLDLKYNVRVISACVKRGKHYDYMSNQLNIEIPMCLNVQIGHSTGIINYINTNNFEFIINNKMNEFVTWPINKKQHFLCHNSMDPVNLTLLDNQSKIATLFTINNYHKKLLISKGFLQPIMLYKNFLADTPGMRNTKTCFHYKIAYIGRLSVDKNVQSLIDGVNLYNEHAPIRVTLYIVGDGNVVLTNLNTNIILTGRLCYDEIVKIYSNVDYVISASVTEGKPFAIIEALSYGVPCIHSNINGISEILFANINGFTFELHNYNTIKFDLTFDNLHSIRAENTTHLNNINIQNVLTAAYEITIDAWNTLSENCIKYGGDKYNKKACVESNLRMFQRTDILVRRKKSKLFINFKPNEAIPYGGGNISVYYIIQHVCGQYKDFDVTFELEPNIKLYLIIDPFKDRNNAFKKYDIHDIVHHRNLHNPTGKIIIRVNDCDKTRTILDATKTREYQITHHFNNIDYFVFNSQFIRDYYNERFKSNGFNLGNNYSIITNGCDQNLFINAPKNVSDKIKIVTHHWSNNMNKGYQLYYDLWKYTQTNATNIEFMFIGKNVPSMFNEVPINGPFVGLELSAELNKNHIYITDSAYDSCPNHVIEAISCGLPILYSNRVGGAKELCTMSPHKIGEIYNSFDELLEKIQLIKQYYNMYRENIVKSSHLFEIEHSISKYYNVFLKNGSRCNNIGVIFDNNIITIKNHSELCYIVLNEYTYIKLVKGQNVFALNRVAYPNIQIVGDNYSYSVSEFNHSDKLNNNKINVLLCSDRNYYVGLFAVLYSVIQNTEFFDKIHFNFMVPIEKTNDFANMLFDFEMKIGKELDKTILYMDSHILHPVFFETKCYNGGGHLLNMGNLSRMLIGEFMDYEKLLYLDSDSIVQNDIIEKIMHFELKYDMYAACANNINENNEKQIVIRMKSVIDCNYDWKTHIGHTIDENEYVYMGAPFLTNCKKWGDIYTNMIKLIKAHNQTRNGVYKLFTMSIQNVLFHNRIGDINEFLHVLQDLGSLRKKWDTADLIEKDVLDWSGIYKPWYANGLYRNWWLYYDIMNLSNSYGKVITEKNRVELFRHQI